jgi:hypothetical protein
MNNDIHDHGHAGGPPCGAPGGMPYPGIPYGPDIPDIPGIPGGMPHHGGIP